MVRENEHLFRKVTVQCTNCGATIYKTLGNASREFHWCEDCRPERDRELQRQHDAKRREKHNAIRRKRPRHCLWPGCDADIAGAPQGRRYCDEHKRPPDQSGSVRERMLRQAWELYEQSL